MTTIFHADDYGITADQARAILALCRAGAQRGALSSVSIFANSPAFVESAALAAPFVEHGTLKMAVHLNLVEGPCCADPATIPLLVDERGMFRNNFVGLLKLSFGSQRETLCTQAETEFRAQIARFLEAFPLLKDELRLDSHQHTHVISPLFEVLLAAAADLGCTLEHVRLPAEPLRPHITAGGAKRLRPVNLAKDALLSTLCHSARQKLPASCATSVFCGVALSGHMDQVDAQLVQAFERYAADHETDLEVLFHPISVPFEQCLDPQNLPFATVCAAPARDAEARTLSALAASLPSA